MPDTLDLDAALARTYEKHGRLVRARRRRSRLVLGSALAVAAIAGVGVAAAVRDAAPTPVAARPSADGSSTAAPTTTASIARSVVAPAGYTLWVGNDGVTTLQRIVTDPDPTTTTTVGPWPSTSGGSAATVGIGTAMNEERHLAVVSAVASPLGDNVVRVTFACVGGAGDVVESVRYRVSGSRVIVDAVVGNPAIDGTCRPGAPGASIDVPLPTVWSGGPVDAGNLG